MNTVTAGLRNPLTTLIGVILAGLEMLKNYNDGELSFENWQSWIIPVLIAMLGFLARDVNKSSESTGIK